MAAITAGTTAATTAARNDDQATDTVEQIRRILANPRRTRR